MKLIKREENFTVKNAFERYQRSNKIKKLSEMTIDLKERNFLDFSKFINVDEYNIKDLDLDLVEEYIEWLIDKGQKTTTINIKLRDLKAFLYWCMENNYLEPFKIKLLREDEVIKETYNYEQLKKLLKKPNLKKADFSEYRNYCAICFLLSTGIRCNSFLNIKIGDLDLKNSLLKLNNTKGRLQQILPLSNSIVELLEEYI